jgi:hypothetical protein
MGDPISTIIIRGATHGEVSMPQLKDLLLYLGQATGPLSTVLGGCLKKALTLVCPKMQASQLSKIFIGGNMETKRSDGILVLGIIATVFGMWGLIRHFSSELIILTDPQLYSQMLQTRGAKAAQFYYFEAIYTLTSFLLFIVGGFAVLKLKNWGRILLIATSAVEFVASLIFPYVWTLIMSDKYHKAFFLPTPFPILYAVNVWFFTKRRIREQFRLKPKEEDQKEDLGVRP